MYIRKKKLEKIVAELDVALIGLRVLASFKDTEQFDGKLWLGIYSQLCEIAEELERTLKKWKRK